MKIFEGKYICLIFLLLAVVFCLTPNRAIASDEHVPGGVTMQTEFKPGFGEPLGLFKKIIGRVVAIHGAETSGYWAESDLPLYMKDKVVTPIEGLALLQFLDDSTISVAEDSELIINRFIFDPDKYDRSTFLNLQAGKSRFWVKKLKDYTRSEFKVKTKTLIAGVRGSDFVIEVRQDSTEVFALEDTVLEVFSLAAPGKIVVLQAFEKVKVGIGQEVSPIEKITPAEAARLRQELPMPFDKGVMEAAGIFKTKGEGKAEAKEEEKKKAMAAEAGKTDQAAPEVAVKKETIPTEEAGLAPNTPEPAETTPRLKPTEEVYQAGQAAAEVAVKEEVVPTDEEKTTIPETMEPILDLNREAVILIAEEDLAPPVPVIEESTAAEPTGTDWFSRSMTLDPGTVQDIADVPLADAAGQVAAEDVVQSATEDILQSFIISDVLVPLPGLPGTP